MKYMALLLFILYSSSCAAKTIDNVEAVILAAGRSSRFVAAKSKLLTPFCGKEMLLYPIEAAQKSNIPVILVLGHQKEAILSLLEEKKVPITHVVQDEPRGTAHAVNVARKKLTKETILVLNGDGPMVDENLLEGLLQRHFETDATITFVTAENTDPTLSVGRVFVDDKGTIEIIEDKAFTGDRSLACQINAGIYVIKRTFLDGHIDTIEPYAWGEVGIPELIKIATEKNERVSTFETAIHRILGINTLKELAYAEKVKRQELVQYWMTQGVRFIDPENTIIDTTVSIGPYTTIGAGVHLLNAAQIGSYVTIGPYAIVDDATIADTVSIEPHAVIHRSQIFKTQ